jgi:hypothetical protein
MSFRCFASNFDIFPVPIIITGVTVAFNTQTLYIMRSVHRFRLFRLFVVRSSYRLQNGCNNYVYSPSYYRTGWCGSNNLDLYWGSTWF